MKIAMIFFVGVIAMTVVAYFLLLPPNTFFSLSRSTSGTVTISRTSFSRSSGGTATILRTGVSFKAAPDRFDTNGFDHIEPYVSRLLVPTNQVKLLHLFTPDGTRGFAFDAKDGVVHAGFTVEWQQESQREAAIRKLFSSFGIAPSRDYLAGNGGVPDATRVLEYPVTGSTTEVTALTKHILQELCDV